MTIGEAIKHCEEVAVRERDLSKADGTTSEGCLKCAEEHEQLAEWLKDYKRLLEERPQSDLISREALKKVLCEEYEVREHYIGEKMLDAIDNAPTVEAYSFEQVQELVKLNQQFAQEIEDLKRLRGSDMRGNKNDK